MSNPDPANEVRRLRALLSLALEAIEGLAGQQAMDDPFWEPAAEQLRAELNRNPEPAVIEGRAIRFLPATVDRVETGAVQFGTDWPGLFIRGDNCAALGMSLHLLAPHIAKLSASEQIMIRSGLSSLGSIAKDVTGIPFPSGPDDASKQ